MKRIFSIVLCTFLLVLTACKGTAEPKDYSPGELEVWQGFDNIEQYVARSETESVTGTNVMIHSYDKKGREIINQYYLDIKDDRPLISIYYRYNTDGSSVQKSVTGSLPDLHDFSVVNSYNQTIAWYEYKLSNGEYTLLKYSTIEYPDSESGLASKQIIYSADNTEISSMQRITDETGTEVITMSEKGVIKSVSTKNMTMFLNETKYYNDDGTIDRIEKEDYEDGKLIGTTVYSSDGTVKEKQVIAYNSAGIIQGVEIYDSQGNFVE